MHDHVKTSGLNLFYIANYLDKNIIHELKVYMTRCGCVWQFVLVLPEAGKSLWMACFNFGVVAAIDHSSMVHLCTWLCGVFVLVLPIAGKWMTFFNFNLTFPEWGQWLPTGNIWLVVLQGPPLTSNCMVYLKQESG